MTTRCTETRRCAITALLLLGFSNATAAMVLEDAATGCDPGAFIEADGHQAIDPATLTGDDWYSSQVFPRHDANRISMPDADLDPATRAMLLVEHFEPPVEQARWELRYRLLAGPESDPRFNTCAVVELRRYNLTASVHQALVGSLGDDAVAAPGAEVSIPHVSWRFWMSSTMGMRADLMAAARRVINDAEAEQARCLGQPCLAPDLRNALLESRQFEPWMPPALPLAPVYLADWPPTGQQMLAGPVRTVEELFFQATVEGDEEPLPADATDRVQMTFVVSRNDGAPEDAISGFLRETELADDAIREIWYSRSEAAGFGEATTEWQRLIVPSRSPR